MRDAISTVHRLYEPRPPRGSEKVLLVVTDGNDNIQQYRTGAVGA